jgi:hypothetical protein
MLEEVYQILPATSCWWQDHYSWLVGCPQFWRYLFLVGAIGTEDQNFFDVTPKGGSDYKDSQQYLYIYLSVSVVIVFVFIVWILLTISFSTLGIAPTFSSYVQ